MGVLYTHKRETCFHFQGFGTFTADKTHHSHFMLVVFYHLHLGYFIVGLSVEIDFAVAILIARKGIVVGLLNLPIANVIVGTANIH